MIKHRGLLISIGVGIACASMFFSLFHGSTPIPIHKLLFTKSTIFLKLRLTRTMAAFVSGGLLALGGCLMQILLQNPLADPYILGISGGAALMTLLMMLLGLSENWLIGGAILGSLLSILLIIAMGKKHQWHANTLLLTGIALACGFSACISFILLLSPNANIHSMLFWLTGEICETQFPWLGIFILGIGFCLCCILAPALNLLSRGEHEAQALGLACKNYRIYIFVLASLFTAIAVTLAGCIGFIGLIIPHLTRLLVGFDHRNVLPLAMLLGGSLLMIADTLARTLFAPQQLPVGILMTILGVPVFIWLIQK